MWTEFKAFLLKANVLALALAVIVGAALGNVVTSLVNDVIMPVVGKLVGGVDFQNLFIDLSGKGYPTLKAAKEAGAATVNYGVFVNTVIVFAIVAFVVFLIARSLVKEAPAAPTRPCPRCTQAIPSTATRCPFCTSELVGSAV